MNLCAFKGWLVADPELRQTASNISVTKFTVAVDRITGKDGEKQADFIRCTAWRATAEFVSKYFVKGQEICFRGQLRNNDYTDGNGVKHYSYDVMVDNVEFCGKKNSNPGEGSAGQSDSEVLGDLGEFEEILSDGECPF